MKFTEKFVSIRYFFAMVAIAALSGVAVAGQNSQNQQNQQNMPGVMDHQQPGVAAKTMTHDQMTKKSPKDVCQEIVTAAKNDDTTTADQWSLGMMPHSDENANPGQPGIAAPLSQFNSLSCGRQTIAGDHAFVEGKSKAG